MMNNHHHHHHHIPNKNSSNDPRRRRHHNNLVVLNGGGRGITTLSPSHRQPQPHPQQLQQQQRPMNVQRQTLWTCDICQVAKFQDYNEACRHEALCQSIQQNLKKAAALEHKNMRQQQQQQQQRQVYRQPLPSIPQHPPITVKPTSPPRKQASPPSTPPKNSTTTTQQEASPNKSKIWTCDICLVAQFDTYKEASQHEQNCPIQKKKKPNIVWNCDVCKIAQFDTFEEAQAHESICKGAHGNDSSSFHKGKEAVKQQQQQRITWTCDVCKIAEFDDFDDACRHEAQCGTMKFDNDDAEEDMDVVPILEEISKKTPKLKKRKKKKIQVPIFDHVLLLASKKNKQREQKSRAAKDRNKNYDEDYSSDDASFSSSYSSLEEHSHEDRECDGPILDMSIMTSLKDYIGGRKCGSTDCESDDPSIIPPELILPTTSLKENYQEWFYESESDSEVSSVQMQTSHWRPTNRTNPTNVKKEKQSIWV